MEFNKLGIVQLNKGLESKEFSALELCKEYLKGIDKRDGDISAFLQVTEDSAIAAAQNVDKKIAKGEKLPLLAGIPCAIKDNILVEGIRCTAGSKILENYIAPYDATVVKKLKEQDAVIIGKTNMDEFAMGSSTENSSYKVTKNPHDLSRVPGGSSGGSAAAVAANLCVFALGSDTGGSIRQPASFCGVAGLKPTYGAVSRYGLMAMASSLDQIGSFAKNVEDCEAVFKAISGKDTLDATSVDTQPLNHSAAEELSELVIGVPKEYFIKGMDPEVEKLIRQAIKKYESLGAKIVEVSLPHTEYALAAYYIIMPAEVSANLARFDGIKYGHSEIKNSKIKDLLSVYLQSRENGFGAEARRRIMLGTYTLSAGYYDAYYLRAQKIRTLIQKDFQSAFKKVDVLMTPVSPTPAFKIGEKSEDPLKMYLSDIFTVSVNLAGLPAISVPCGMINELPVGLQIIGKPFEEKKIFDIAKILKNAS
jgi:aspartyl-tRNA(Asn)/glutamyl-tRNA(Gln) amidotransferase subunit A